MTPARPDTSHLYAVAYAEMRIFTEQLTDLREPTIPHTVLASAMLEVAAELMDHGYFTLAARECVAEAAGETFIKLAGPLPFEMRASLDFCVARLLCKPQEEGKSE